MNERHYIYILPIGIYSDRFLEALGMEIEFHFDLPCRLMKSVNLPEHTYNPERLQYRSLQILKQVLDLSPDDAIKILGLCNVDLYIPIQDFIFGQAQFNGLASMVSMRRLTLGSYEGAANEAVTFHRTLKEVNHELGHAFGLLHCDSPYCGAS